LTGEIWVFAGAQIGYVWVMPKSSRERQLREAYRFAGFFPANTVYGVFGNPQVRVLALHRRQKKQAVGFASDGTAAFTIRNDVWCGICPVASIASIWSYSCAA
jgi:hypothetical protein